jgi:hypothetical protein
VRQAGKFSFTRVYDAGHEIFAYQPEMLQKIFQRTMSGLDVATGATDLAEKANYGTVGPSTTWAKKNVAPKAPKVTCYVLAPSTCSGLQQEAVQEGYAVIENFIMTGLTPDAPSDLSPSYDNDQPTDGW